MLALGRRPSGPRLAVIDTWNDATNHHMIAINERLGCTVVAHPPGVPGGPLRAVRARRYHRWHLLPTRS